MKHRSIVFGMLAAASIWVVGGASAFAASTFRVTVGTYFFNPTNITVLQGDSIVWTNTAFTAHDTAQGTATTPPSQRLWTSPNLPAAIGNYRFTFTNMGTYPYICVQHISMHPEQTGTVSVLKGNLGPNVNITAPALNSRHPAPPNFLTTATATDPDGSVTNVFFTATATSGGNFFLLGSVRTPPYSIPVTNLPPANYNLRAVAIDNEGLSTTSAVVGVQIATPVPLVLTNLLVDAQSRFQLSFPTTFGLSYVMEESSDVQGGWKPVITNSGSGSRMTNTRPFNASSPTQRLYRAFIQP